MSLFLIVVCGIVQCFRGEKSLDLIICEMKEESMIYILCFVLRRSVIVYCFDPMFDCFEICLSSRRRVFWFIAGESFVNLVGEKCVFARRLVYFQVEESLKFPIFWEEIPVFCYLSLRSPCILLFFEEESPSILLFFEEESPILLFFREGEPCLCYFRWGACFVSLFSRRGG